jgi:predicted metal-dependent HD superfamily phosphohydrolase
MLYAWLFHDVDSNEDKSIEIALDSKHLSLFEMDLLRKDYFEIYSKVKKDITSLIEATKHKSWEYQTEEERLFASVDLMNLGGDSVEYCRYNNLVCDEYRMMEKLDKMDKFNEDEYFQKWVRGRRDFINKFLDRKLIYPSGKTTFTKREKIARQNLFGEMSALREDVELL